MWKYGQFTSGHIGHTKKNRLLDYYKIISISRPILARANMGLDFVSGQYGCLFSRCRRYIINSLIHGHFHIGLVIIPRPILTLDSVSGQYGGLGMITRPIWKCPCINLYLINVFIVLFRYRSWVYTWSWFTRNYSWYRTFALTIFHRHCFQMLTIYD